jgi:hypothetical protein|tara:strand:+ start:90 stop:305 length:216 start_codon:yes stop_codon:yes gene_type:complete
MVKKWKIWKKVMNTETKPAPVKYCCNCGGIKTRQTKLDEFADMTPESQTKLPFMTESIGRESPPRKYRGMI